VDGINGAVDFNVFNGSAEELQAFVEGTLKQ
ncbi:glycoside hydrolase family 25 protein, partial [Escherichia albertii]|nr:glycoside hydrolase family 25 protein [Escherichia albertii]